MKKQYITLQDVHDRMQELIDSGEHFVIVVPFAEEEQDAEDRKV